MKIKIFTSYTIIDDSESIFTMSLLQAYLDHFSLNVKVIKGHDAYYIQTAKNGYQYVCDRLSDLSYSEFKAKVIEIQKFAK